jgi:integrase
MPRKKVWPPPLKPHKASGQGRCRWGGHDYYFGPWGDPQTQEAYQRFVARLEAQGGNAPAPGHAAPCRTVADVVAAWLEQESGRYDPGGEEVRHVRTACAALTRLHGSDDAATFDALALEGVRTALLSGSWRSEEERQALKKAGREVGYCVRHAGLQVNRIRRVWRWAERKKLVPRGSWGELRTLPAVAKGDRRYRHSTPRKPVAFERVRAVALACPPAVRDMVLLQWWAGMRSQEVRLMRSCDIDRTGEVWLYRPHKHKCSWRGQDRVVPLGPKCQALLRPYLAGSTSQDAYLFRPRRKGSLLYGRSSYAARVRVACDRLGVERIFPYLCRHSAKQRITREMGLDVARSVLGQASIETTNGYGDAIDLEQAKKAARRMG